VASVSLTSSLENHTLRSVASVQTKPSSSTDDSRNDFEDLCLSRLAEILSVAVTILADRGFDDTKLFAFLATLSFAYVIRLRGNIHVTAADGETRPRRRLGRDRRTRKLRDAEVTAGRRKVRVVVCVHAKNVKEPWCLRRHRRRGLGAQDHGLLRQALDHRAEFSRHEDLRFGMGMSAIRIADPQRRDRLFLLNAVAIVLLPLPGFQNFFDTYDDLIDAACTFGANSSPSQTTPVRSAAAGWASASNRDCRDLPFLTVTEQLMAVDTALRRVLCPSIERLFPRTRKGI
jgi:hypothetical protein